VLLLLLRNLITKGKKKRKRNEKKQTKEQTSRQQQAEKRQRKDKQQMAVEVHKAHLMCLLAHHYHTNAQLEDELLQVRPIYMCHLSPRALCD
jgi:hypothetical protein